MLAHLAVLVGVYVEVKVWKAVVTPIFSLDGLIDASLVSSSTSSAEVDALWDTKAFPAGRAVASCS